VTRAKWLRKPIDLSPEARRYWDLHGPALHAGEQSASENAEDFKLLCRLLATARIASDEIERFGITVGTPSGGCKANPAVAALISAQRAARPVSFWSKRRERDEG